MTVRIWRNTILKLTLFTGALSSGLLLIGLAGAASGQTISATYVFNNSYAAQEAGKPLLNQVLEGSSTANFTTETVFGSSRTVLAENGSPANNAGLTVNTGGTLIPSANYTFETVFEFTSGQGAWRKILDVTSRGPDVPGLYVSPGNILTTANGQSGPTPWTNDVYHHVVLTNDGSVVAAYLDGAVQFTAPTSGFTIDASNLMNFFLDDAATSKNEYGANHVALIRLWSGALNASQVSTQFQNPFTGTGGAATPEPGSVALLAAFGVPGALLAMRRRRK
jgi:hypothetical protein